jgi:sugar lactone lactonase YvrE
LKCLQKSPKARYGSPVVLAADLQRWLAGEPILARPVRLPERVWRWTRRNPAKAGLVGAFLFVLIGAGAGAIWYQADLHRREAEQTLRKQYLNQLLGSAIREFENQHGSVLKYLANPPEGRHDVDRWEKATREAQAAWRTIKQLTASDADLVETPLADRMSKLEDGMRLEDWDKFWGAQKELAAKRNAADEADEAAARKRCEEQQREQQREDARQQEARRRKYEEPYVAAGIGPAGKIIKLHIGLKFNSSAADREGNVYLSDILNERILNLDRDGKLSVFRDKCKIRDMMVNVKGEIVACEITGAPIPKALPYGRVVAINVESGNVRVLAEVYDGKPLTPLRLVLDGHGGVYFTAHGSPRPGGGYNESPAAYYVSPAGKVIRLLDKAAGGIMLSPDEKNLYVVNPGGLFTYPMEANGKLGKPRFLLLRWSLKGEKCTVDTRGNLYFTAFYFHCLL